MDAIEQMKTKITNSNIRNLKNLFDLFGNFFYRNLIYGQYAIYCFQKIETLEKKQKFIDNNKLSEQDHLANLIIIQDQINSFEKVLYQNIENILTKGMFFQDIFYYNDEEWFPIIFNK